MTLCSPIMKPKTMVAVKQEMSPVARTTVLVNNPLGAQRSVIANGSDLMRCKRKLGYLPGQQPQQYPAQPASVARRNARERNRVKQVNNGFATLRSHIPPAVAAAVATEKTGNRNSAANKKLSKVETLKMAVEYIRNLQDILEEHGGSVINTKSDAYEMDEDRYYSSSPDTVVSTSETQYYSPDYVKSEPADGGFYSPGRNYIKADGYQNFNSDVHETLTSEFYHARSPPKAYSSPDREPSEAHSQTHAFLQPRGHIMDHRGSTSLSPPISEPSPSPTPSYASDNSSLHPGSTSSGHLTTQLSRLTTVPPFQPPPVRRGSPGDYEKSDGMSPEDEELLDVISWWQETN